MTALGLPAIRALLEGIEVAGGLPWRRVTNTDGTGAGVVDSSGSVIGYGTSITVADLLAAAPSIVAQLVAVVERVEGLAAELAAESLASRNVAREIGKEPVTNITRQEIRDHEQAATIATNHATRIWNALTGEGQS